MSGIWMRGRRLFSTSAILMLLTALAHTAGNLAPTPPLPGELEVTAAMQAFHDPLGMGMNPSIWDILRDLAFTMSITFAAIAILNLTLAASRDMPDRLLRRVGWINAGWLAAFTILCFMYRIPPPLISG